MIKWWSWQKLLMRVNLPWGKGLQSKNDLLQKLTVDDLLNEFALEFDV